MSLSSPHQTSHPNLASLSAPDRRLVRVFEGESRYRAFYLPGPHELPTDEAVASGLKWLLDEPGSPLIVLSAKKVARNNRLLASAISRFGIPVVAPPHLWEASWTGGSILAPWASERALAGVDDDLSDRVNAVCVIGWGEGQHTTWILGHGARDLRYPDQAPANPLLDPVVEVAMGHATRAINHNNALVQAEDKAYVVLTLQELVRAGYHYDVEMLCAWAMAHGWTGQEVANLRDYANRVLEARTFRLHSRFGPQRGASAHWVEEAVGRTNDPGDSQIDTGFY